MNPSNAQTALDRSVAADPACREPASRIDAPHGFAALRLELLLYGLQSPINIGMILRVAEAYQFRVSILDPGGVLDDPQKFQTIKEFACGAVGRRDFRRLERASSLAEIRHGRRVVATLIDPKALTPAECGFQADDLIVLGNEYDGLPSDVVAAADVCLHVPMAPVWMPKEPSHNPIDPTRRAPVARDGQPSLNVAVTAGIVCYSAYSTWLAENAIGRRRRFAEQNAAIPAP
jgi:tRNA G18 (ribose-2'-O)-methylase SpoU